MSKKFSKLGVVLAVPALLLSAGVELAAANSTPLGDTQILETGESWKTCQEPLIENPYSRYGDTRDYVLAPGGSFEDAGAPGWQLSGAAVVPGDDAFTERDKMITAHDDGSLLELSPGATAISPAMCVDLNYPLFRLTANAVTRPDDAEILVEVVYPNAENPAFEEVKKFDGKQGDFRATSLETAESLLPRVARWNVSDEIDLKPDLGGQQWGGRLAALRFTVLRGTWRVDDVYVDPRRHS